MTGLGYRFLGPRVLSTRDDSRFRIWDSKLRGSRFDLRILVFSLIVINPKSPRTQIIGFSGPNTIILVVFGP